MCFCDHQEQRELERLQELERKRRLEEEEQRRKDLLEAGEFELMFNVSVALTASCIAYNRDYGLAFQIMGYYTKGEVYPGVHFLLGAPFLKYHIRYTLNPMIPAWPI